MADQFTADPTVLRTEGNSIVDKAQQFGQNVEKVYATLDEMLSSAYVSRGAAAIGASIRTYRDTLDQMTKAINDYGAFCLGSQNTVNRNEDDIVDSANRNVNTTNI